MAAYPDLSMLSATISPGLGDAAFDNAVIPYLVNVWLDDYARAASKSEVIETKAADFSYLFDIAAERLIAAWGVSGGRHAGARDSARMAGHPKSAGPHYHRGHAIPHTLGGPTDINLVPQLGSINVGPFRKLEKEAVATPGSLYFTYWIYGGAAASAGGHPGQTPTGVDQGLLVPGRPPRIEHHSN